jgi:hypothetical protein
LDIIYIKYKNIWDFDEHVLNIVYYKLSDIMKQKDT